MDFETIIVERKNYIGIITLNRPEQLNTFTTTMAGELNQALANMDQDQEIRVVIINSSTDGEKGLLHHVWHGIRKGPGILR